MMMTISILLSMLMITVWIYLCSNTSLRLPTIMKIVIEKYWTFSNEILVTLVMNMTIWTAFWQFQIVKMMIWQARNISGNAAVSASFLEAKLVKRARNACTQGNMMRIKQTNMNLVSEKYLWQLQQHLPARFLLSKPLTFGGWRGGECCSVSFAHIFGRRAKIF